VCIPELGLSVFTKCLGPHNMISDVYTFIICLLTNIMTLTEATLGMNFMSVDDFFKETCLHMLSDVSFLILLNINRQYNCFMDIT
jgi:hypothetical protein